MNGRLIDFINEYNMSKRLKKLNYKTPAQYLKEEKGITGLTPIFQHEIGKLEVDSKEELFDC
jgi:hypothetical protein